jgi:hypothetical protein
MPERDGIEILVRKLIVSEAANTFIRNVVVEVKGAQFISQSKQVRGSRVGEAWAKAGLKPRGEHQGNPSVRAGGVGKQSGKALAKGGGAEPEVEPEGGRLAITRINLGDGPEDVESGDNVLPNRSIEAMAVSKVSGIRPTIEASKPAGPRSIRIRVNFCEELREKSGVLSRKRKDPEASKSFGSADIIPGNLALAPIAGLFSSPEKGAPALVNCLKNSSSHSMGQ